MPLSSRRAMRFILSSRTLAALALLPVGCADLSLLSPDVCGNGVVEEDEDCDGQDTCGKVGTPNACRFLCSAEQGVTCPAGKGLSCGVDGVCRGPRGRSSGEDPPEFTIIEGGTTPPTLDFFTADLNVDGCHELVQTTPRGVTITSFDSDAAGYCHASTQEIPGRQPPPDPDGPLELRPAPILADLDKDGRPDLLRPRDTPEFYSGIAVYAAGDRPSVSPLLHPTYRNIESGGKPLRVRIQKKDGVLLWLAPSAGSPAQPFLIDRPEDKPRPLSSSLSVALDHIAVLAAADLWGKPDGTPDDCDEVVLGVSGSTQANELTAFSLCGPNMMPGTPVKISLDSGATLRQRAASIALVDMNMDGALDVVLNATDAHLHVAYGNGKGAFRSTPDEMGPPDNTTSILPMNPMELDPMLTAPEFTFVADRFDGPTNPPRFVALPCPPSGAFVTPACAFIPGSCEATVIDIDADGLLDIISSEEQKDGVTVRRSAGSGKFRESFLDTQCPPHYLAAGDFDDDGVNDIAYFDQRVTLTTKGAVDRAVATLQIAYGAPLAAPELPVESGIYEDPVGLVTGRLLSSAQADQLFAVRDLPKGEMARTGVALVGGDGDRLLSAPFYFPNGAMVPDNFTFVEIDAAAAGRFGNENPDDSRHGAAVVTRSPSEDPTTGERSLVWLEPHSSGTSLRSVGAAAVECDQCVLAAVPPGGAEEPDLIVLFNERRATVFSPTVDKGFEPVKQFDTSHIFHSLDSTRRPEGYVARPLVADIDGDGMTDIALTDDDGSMVVFWGKGGGDFEETELVPGAECQPDSPCVRASIALINVDDDDDKEIIVMRRDSINIHDAVTPGSRALGAPLPVMGPQALLPQLQGSDFVSVHAADFDGDGVDDLAVIPYSSIRILLRGVPRLQ